MKIVAYHYVRPNMNEPPNRYYHLNLDNFRKQLDHFERKFNIVTKRRFYDMLDGTETPTQNDVLLTFDDGLRDHYEWVYPELTSRGLWGLFFVSTGPYVTGEVLDVHRIHHLLGNVQNDVLLDSLDSVVTDDMIQDEYRERFSDIVYGPEQDATINEFKTILNYLIPVETRKKVLSELESIHGLADINAQDFYVTEDELREMVRNGLTIGSHTKSHRVLSKLTTSEQHVDLSDAHSYLTKTVNLENIDTFCYPMGREWTFNDETIQILKKLGFKCAFCVDPKPVTDEDYRERPYRLPRYDCNQFPHGEASGHPQ